MAKYYRDLLPDELAALRLFAAEYGKKWKDKLHDYWMSARIFRARDGKEYPVLHKLRNELGPRWLAGYKLPPEPGEGNYHEFTELPANWSRAVWGKKPAKGDAKLVNAADPYKWSGENEPPKVGAKVTVYMNGLGAGEVLGYFAEYGWLGVLVQLDKPPKWFTKQNNGNPAAHLFGVDLEEKKSG